MANETEEKFRELAEELGFEVTKCGWPDFLCYSEDELIAVEVKPNRGQLKPTRSQARCMAALSRAGIKCFLSEGTRLVPFDPELQPPVTPDHSDRIIV